jgi:hypothetical protein
MLPLLLLLLLLLGSVAAAEVIAHAQVIINDS